MKAATILLLLAVAAVAAHAETKPTLESVVKESMRLTAKAYDICRDHGDTKVCAASEEGFAYLKTQNICWNARSVSIDNAWSVCSTGLPVKQIPPPPEPQGWHEHVYGPCEGLVDATNRAACQAFYAREGTAKAWGRWAGTPR